MSTFTAVVTAHAESPHRILGNLMYQTRKPDEILVFCSEVAGISRLREQFPLATFVEVENRSDWGHAKRASGVAAASGDFLGFFNHDDSYELTYIEKMMAEAEAGADAVYCGWTGEHGNPQPDFSLGSSTSGNFIVRSDLGREAGYLSRAYEADGHFINAVRAGAKRIARVDETLYHHNAQ